MATLETDDANLIDAEATNWRLIVYPLLLVAIVAVGGLGYYYYQQNQRDELETAAHAALVKATTPEDFLKVADQYPHTDQATLAILSAADASFAKRDYPAAIADYHRIADDISIDGQLRDSAKLGLASALEANDKADNAISVLLEVGREGAKSPYAPYAFNTVARIYDQRGDKANERQTLTEAASLDPDSNFTKEAQQKLKQLEAADQPPLTVPLPPTPAPVPAAPTVTPPAPATK